MRADDQLQSQHLRYDVAVTAPDIGSNATSAGFVTRKVGRAIISLVPHGDAKLADLLSK